MSIMHEIKLEYINDQIYDIFNDHFDELNIDEISELKIIEKNVKAAQNLAEEILDLEPEEIVNRLRETNKLIEEVIPEQTERHWRILRNTIKKSVETNNHLISINENV